MRKGTKRTRRNVALLTAIVPRPRVGLMRVGVVYEITYRCGHTKQRTLLLPTTRAGIKLIELTYQHTRTQPCPDCANLRFDTKVNPA